MDDASGLYVVVIVGVVVMLILLGCKRKGRP